MCKASNYLQLISKGAHPLLPHKSYWKFSGGRGIKAGIFMMGRRFMYSLTTRGFPFQDWLTSAF